MESPPSPILVAGMHRSGTSLVASWLAAAGVDMGDRLLAADAGNPRGYFEDVGFLELGRRMLRDAVPPGEAGHPDWGWTESERLDRGVFPAYQDAALALVTPHPWSVPWGWKDPRTTLLLDFWEGLLPTARYVLLYRFPWEVADSMQRLGAEVFLEHPGYAYRIWAFYNRHLLDFYGRHRERCLLLSVDALLQAPERFGPLLAGKLGLDLPETPLAGLLDPGLFARTGADDPLVSLTAAVYPECARLLTELERAADLPAGLGEIAPPEGRRSAGRPVDLSIVIPCHDDGEFLVEALASAERSAPERSEILVVNDGSRAARTLAILSLLRAAGFTVIDQENGGLAAARNHGFREARGRYLLPLDADNRLRPGFPEAAIEVLSERPEVGVVYGDRQEFGRRTGRVRVPELDLDGLLRSNSIDACAAFRREVWEQCDGYDGAMPYQGWEDWDLWIGAAERGWRFHHLPEITFDYRVRPGSMASTLLTAEVGEALRLYIFDKHRDLYRRRLPRLLTAQHETADVQARLDQVAAERDRLAAERDGIAAQRDALGHGLEELEAALATLEARLAAAHDERDRLYAELAAFETRVASMEGTRAWRLRQWLVDLRRRWRF